MLRRVDLLAGLGTSIITMSGGEPLLHPELDRVIRARPRARHDRGPDHQRIPADRGAHQGLNDAGLDHLQISIDNVDPDDVSKKSLKVLDRKLQLLAEHAAFQVNINSVFGAGIRHPEDAATVARRARGTRVHQHRRYSARRLRAAAAAWRRTSMRIYEQMSGSRNALVRPHQSLQSVPAQPGAREAERLVVLPRRRPLPVCLRGRPGALLLPAARASGDSAGAVHASKISAASTPPEKAARRIAPFPASTKFRSSTAGAIRRRGVRRGFEGPDVSLESLLSYKDSGHGTAK